MIYDHILVNGVSIVDTNFEEMNEQDFFTFSDGLWDIIESTGVVLKNNDTWENIYSEGLAKRLRNKVEKILAEQRVKKLEEELSTPIEVDGKLYRKIYKFEIMYVGWECDSYGWVVVDEDNNRHLLLTNHGQEYIAHQNELTSLIKTYEEKIEETKKALNLLDNIGNQNESNKS